MNLYDGSTDPDEHLNIFKTQMTLYTIDRTVWCKVFPTSLREGPLGWFFDLPPNSIASGMPQIDLIRRPPCPFLTSNKKEENP